MRLFYFTYGSEGYPFVGGWTMVAAQDMDKAVTVFRAYHNLGRRCHELIYLSCTKEG